MTVVYGLNDSRVRTLMTVVYTLCRVRTLMTVVYGP